MTVLFFMSPRKIDVELFHTGLESLKGIGIFAPQT